MNRKIFLIIQREFNQRVRKRSFLLTTILTPLLFIGLVFVPVLLINTNLSDKKERIAVIDRTGYLIDSLKSTDRLEFTAWDGDKEAITTAMLSENGFAGVLYIGPNIGTDPYDISLYSAESFSIRDITEIRRQVNSAVEAKKVADLNIGDLGQLLKEIKTNVVIGNITLSSSGVQKSSSSEMSAVIAFLFGFLMYMLIIMNGSAVLSGVIEEKNNRIVEVIISSVKPFELMIGKIIGIGSVALLQFLIWVVITVVLSAVALPLITGNIPLSELTAASQMGTANGIDPETMRMIAGMTDISYVAGILGSFFLFFTGGYMLYAAMYAAVGSAVDNIQDAQQIAVPLLVPLILSIVLISNVTTDHNSPVAFWFSMIPLTSPTVMMARIPFGVPFWQIATSLVILYASFIGMTWMAGRIYRTGIFMYGKKHSLKEMIRWVRYK